MLRVIYDVDDVLNNLNEVAAKIAGVDRAKFIRFNLKECPDLTANELERMYAAYSSLETFKQTSLNPGAKRICGIQRTGLAEVGIHSTSFNQDIIDYKFKVLTTEIPGLNPDLINLVNSGSHKDPIENADIVVEDNLEMLLKYDANTLKILIDRSHNKFENYGMVNDTQGIIRVADLNAAVNLIEAIIEYYALGLNMKKVFDIVKNQE